MQSAFHVCTPFRLSRRHYALMMWRHLHRHHYILKPPPEHMPQPGTDEHVWQLLELVAPLVNRAKQRRHVLQHWEDQARKEQLTGNLGVGLENNATRASLSFWV